MFNQYLLDWNLKSISLNQQIDSKKILNAQFFETPDFFYDKYFIIVGRRIIVMF